MEDRELSIYLSRILSGSYIFIYNNKTYNLKYPSMSTKYAADIFVEQERKKNRFNNWIRQEDVEYFLIDAGIWGPEGSTSIDSLTKQIDDYKVDLYLSYLNPPKVKQIRSRLRSAQIAHQKLLTIKHSLDYITLEGYLSLVKADYLLMHSIYDDKDNLVFDNDYNTKSYEFNNLSKYIDANSISMSVFKELARSSIFRNLWSANKDNIFGKPVVDWTDEQTTLILMARMYDNAYSHPECPPDSIINDDDMFDGWMIHQKREYEKEKEKTRIQKMIDKKGGKNLSKSGEIFLMANSKEEAQSIYNLNDSQSRGVIAERTKTILSSKDSIRAQDMPDTKREIAKQTNEQIKQRMKK